MRLYFWKAALHAIKKSPVTGVGTGDVQDVMNDAYIETHSPLEKEWFKRPHNQFLTVTVALGICGLLIFMYAVFFPAYFFRKELPLLFWPFFITAIVSFLVEDTLETQAGLSFYAFFNALFVSMAVNRGKQE
jgi:O-antigen ligase